MRTAAEVYEVMAQNSNYDVLHDKYHTAATRKAGNKYERLAALVFKVLEEKDTVIHDIRLTGSDPDVKHQIDVTVERNSGRKRHLLIECKDFDISANKVGIGIVRDFRSVLEDTRANEGIILTCNGFSSQARKYAKSKGIKLCILRTFQESDMKNRIRKIVMHLVVQSVIPERASIFIDEQNNEKYQSYLQAAGVSYEGIGTYDPVYFVRDMQREQFCDFISSKVGQNDLWTITKDGRLAMPANGWKLQVESGSFIDFKGIILDVRKEQEKETLEIVSNRVAELILTEVADTDLVIFDDQLETYKIDAESGEVERMD